MSEFTLGMDRNGYYIEWRDGDRFHRVAARTREACMLAFERHIEHLAEEGAEQ